MANIKTTKKSEPTLGKVPTALRGKTARVKEGEIRIPYWVDPKWGIRINNQHWKGKMYLTVSEIIQVRRLFADRARMEHGLLTDKGYMMRIGGPRPVGKSNEMYNPGF